MIDCGALAGNDKTSTGHAKWSCDVDILEFLIDGFICMFPEPECYNPCKEELQAACGGCSEYLPFGNEIDQPYVYNEISMCGKVETDDGIVDDVDQLDLVDMACVRAQ